MYRKVAGSIPDGVIGIFHSLSSEGHYVPGVDPASKRNKYQAYLPGTDKGGLCLGVTTLIHFCDDYQHILEISTSWSPKDLYRDSFKALLQRNNPELLPDVRLPL